MELLTFIFSVEDIQRKVLMLTTTLGSHRQDEAGAHMTDLIALTPGERNQFMDYLDEAKKETYSWVQAYGRGIDVEKVPNCECDIVFSLRKAPKFDHAMVGSIKRNLQDAMVYWIIYRWLENTKPDEAATYLEKHEYAGQQAQYGMNSRIECPHRHYHMF